MTERGKLGRKEIRREKQKRKKQRRIKGGTVSEKWTDGVNIHRSIGEIETKERRIVFSLYPGLSSTFSQAFSTVINY